MSVLVAQQNATGFRWTGRAERVAVMLADDLLTDEEIGRKARISRVQIHRWKQHPEFRDRVARLREEMRDAARREGIGDKLRRLQALNDRHGRMTRVILARAEEMDGEVAGGETGLLVRQAKFVRLEDDTESSDGKKRSTEVYEYAVDTGLLKELREHEKQAAQEVGDWAEKHEHSGKDGGPIPFTFTFDRAPDGD